MNGHPICYIVGSLPLPPTLTPTPNPKDLIIAADGGHLHLASRGIQPHLVVGDFDSSIPPTDHPMVIHLPVEKDDTDVGYAIRVAVERRFTRFVLLGCFGGLFDHTMANIQHLHSLSVAGHSAILVGDGQCATVITNGSLTLQEAAGKRCSVFALGGSAHGVTLENLHYTLSDATLSPTTPLGVSNSFTTQPAQISVADGSVLVVWDYTANPITFI